MLQLEFGEVSDLRTFNDNTTDTVFGVATAIVVVVVAAIVVAAVVVAAVVVAVVVATVVVANSSSK